MNYNLIHPHCGPFNTMADKPPKDPIDRACYYHDLAYAKLGPEAYYKMNKADYVFMAKMKQLIKKRVPGWQVAEMYLKSFEIKKATTR